MLKCVYRPVILNEVWPAHFSMKLNYTCQAMPSQIFPHNSPLFSFNYGQPTDARKLDFFTL